MKLSVIEVVKRTVAVTAVVTAARIEISIICKPFYSTEHRLGLAGRFEAAPYGIFNLKSSYAPKKRRRQAKKAAKLATGHGIRRKVQMEIQSTG